MPRKPTLLARRAKEELRARAATLPDGAALPVLGELGTELQLHASTIFRILRDLVTEGVYWQSPNGRFFPASARAEHVRGLPLCFIGREMWQWSRLYQELLEGVSEVCSANASPLVILSAPSLVRQPDPQAAPQFAGPAAQAKELRALVAALPRPCGGLLLDHLWCDAALRAVGGGHIPTVQLVHGSGRVHPVVGPDFSASAAVVSEFVASRNPAGIDLVVPFEGDPAIDHGLRLLTESLRGFPIRRRRFTDGVGRILSRRAGRSVIVCPEDNIAQAIADRMETSGNHSATLLATQGTGVLHAPVTRLRFDFRRMGKAAAAHLLHGTAFRPAAPLLLQPGGAS